MGDQKHYNPSGGFSEYKYIDASERITINDVTGKMIKPAEWNGYGKYGLPTYSNTCDIYFKQGPDGQAVQAKVYYNREMILDFDWSHSHKNKNDGQVFPEGTIHVQCYIRDESGKFVRLSSEAHYMTQAQIDKYGPIIRFFNPKVKFS